MVDSDRKRFLKYAFGGVIAGGLVAGLNEQEGEEPEGVNQDGSAGERLSAAGGSTDAGSEHNTAESSLTVESSGPVDEYRNQQGEVDTDGLQTAINDFINQDISTGVLQNVINAFLST